MNRIAFLDGGNEVEAINNQTSYFAYLRIFDANNKLERKNLLQKIILNPFVSYLFIDNCFPNENELEQAFSSIVNDPKSCYLFLKQSTHSDELYRRKALNTILNDFNYSYKTAQECTLKLEELRIIFNKYKSDFVEDNSIESYYQYCNIFSKLISEEDVAILINKIFDDQNQQYVKKVLVQLTKISLFCLYFTMINLLCCYAV